MKTKNFDTCQIERLTHELREEREAFLSRQTVDSLTIAGMSDELKMAHEVVQNRDTEIERLRKVVGYYKSRKLEALITELAAVVDHAQVLMGWSSYDALLKRVQEATILNENH